MHVKIVFPQAAELSIHFEGKLVVLHLLEGSSDLRGTAEGKKEKKKSPALGGNRTHHLKSFPPQTELI